MVCGAVAEAVQRSEAHVAEALRLEETLRERIAALPPADFEDILHSAFILSLHVRPGASVLHVRATPTSLLRAVLVRTRGTGQLAPERHALYVHRTRITLGRAGRAPLRSAPPPYYYYITVPRAVAPQVFKEDEWKLFALGGAMGLAIGVAQAYALTR